MATTFQAQRAFSNGDVFQWVTSVALTAWTVVVLDGILGIVEHDYAAGDLAAATKVGIYFVRKVNGDISRGAIVYWDEDGNPQGGTAGSGAATTTSTNNTPMGRVLAAAGATDEWVLVRLFDAETVTNTTTSVGPLTNEITDPGDGEAIPVTASGTCMMESAGAETRTLADPTFLGQELMLTDDVHVGNIVVTAASPVNQTGNNTLTFGAAGDTIHLIAIKRAGALEWHVDSNDGVALSTV